MMHTIPYATDSQNRRAVVRWMGAPGKRGHTYQILSKSFFIGLVDADVDGFGVLYFAEAAVFTGPFAYQGVLTILGFKEFSGSFMWVESFYFLTVTDGDGSIGEEGIESQLIVFVGVFLVVHGDLDDQILRAAFQQLDQICAVGVGVV